MSVQRCFGAPDFFSVYGLAHPLSPADTRWVITNRVQRRLLRVPGVREMEPFARRDLIHACADRVADALAVPPMDSLCVGCLAHCGS